MKLLFVLVLLVSFSITAIAFADSASGGRNVDMKSSDGTQFEGTILLPPNQGLVYCCFIRAIATRKSWDSVPSQLAAAGD